MHDEFVKYVTWMVKDIAPLAGYVFALHLIVYVAGIFM